MFLIVCVCHFHSFSAYVKTGSFAKWKTNKENEIHYLQRINMHVFTVYKSIDYQPIGVFWNLTFIKNNRMVYLLWIGLWFWQFTKRNANNGCQSFFFIISANGKSLKPNCSWNGLCKDPNNSYSIK